MEPMCSAFQEDVKCYEEGVDFMLGDSLLVANVVEKGAVSRKVYLPEGETFYDFYTRAAYEVDAPWSSLWTWDPYLCL